ncbi:MAG: hypothetical protein EBZ77_03785, partial [Chitinophagia bacterium]|nr:hypothetical protein [Chitinophagia bacterium]
MKRVLTAKAFSTTHYLSPRWVAYTCMLIFVLLRLPALLYPFFWDESWSYAPAVQLMHQHGPSLSPIAIATSYSRGHPLLFYATAAAWMNLAGTSHLAMHAFALLVATFFLIALLEITLRHFGATASTAVVVLCSTSLLFLVQSTMVLPEIFLALWLLLSLHFFAEKRFGLLAASLTLALFTKEASLVLAGVLVVWSVVALFGKEEWKTRLARLTAVAAPCLAIACFYLWQKKLLGWYFFPEHLG